MKGKILAVVTARSGSKRLANKNILNLAGKPLITWTIDAAKKSIYIDKLIVSTDSLEIKKIAENSNAEVPFLRPLELSNDTSSSVSVLKHAIDFFKEEYKYIMLLQPTSPFRSSEDIDKAIELLNTTTKSVVSVTESEHSPLWTNTLPSNLSMKNFLRDELKNVRSQDLPNYFRLNGAIYIAEVDYFNQINGFIGGSTSAFIMPNERSIDIDTKLDFDFAQFYYNSIQKK